MSSGIRCRLGIVPDEEREEEQERGADLLVEEGFRGDFAITGEPTDMLVGVAAKGVFAMRIKVGGHAAHGATPWLGRNAILRAIEVFHEIESLPFAQESSELYDRPSINLGRILGGDALNKVPDACVIDVDVRYLPEQEPETILQQVSSIEGAEVISTFHRPPALVDPQSPFVSALRDAASPHHPEEVTTIGRHGASDAVSFLRAGIPTVEFGPSGAGHHGPDEWVSIPSLVELPAHDLRLRRLAAHRHERRAAGMTDEELPENEDAKEGDDDARPPTALHLRRQGTQGRRGGRADEARREVRRRRGRGRGAESDPTLPSEEPSAGSGSDAAEADEPAADTVPDPTVDAGEGTDRRACQRGLNADAASEEPDTSPPSTTPSS